MATVVRVKRLLEEEPLDAVVINCKKRKIEDNVSSEPLAAVLKFVGTVDGEDVDILKHIKKPTKVEAEKYFKSNNFDIMGKLRQKRQLASKESRYKVINCFRTNGAVESESSDTEGADSKESYTIFDVELQEKKAETIQTKTEENYVYDLYYTQSDYLGDSELNEMISVYPLSDELVYVSNPNNDLSDAEESYDSEDSNAENYFRNDYPDEESSDDESYTESTAFYESPVTDEEIIHSMEYLNTSGFTDDFVSMDDVERYGIAYARFKARYLNDALYEDEDYDD